MTIHDRGRIGWTPRLVRDTMTEAVSWAKSTAGRVGPAGIKSTLPYSPATLEDHLIEGWGLPEVADDGMLSDDRPIALPVSPERADYLMRALSWQAIYLVNNGHYGSARILGMWLHHKTTRAGQNVVRGDLVGFDRAIEKIGLSRGHAYRMRDRALSIIAQGLVADGVPHEQ